MQFYHNDIAFNPRGLELTLPSDLITRFLGAIESDTLVFLCGAGLSIPMPSDLPSAVNVARTCYDAWQPVEQLEPALRDDIDQLAAHFHARGDFKNRFIPLVPWNELTGQPNRGHAAISDLLISRGARAALSANFDTMIESWAAARKVAMQGALIGQEAIDFATCANPLLKFHGCLQRSREATLWTQGQLSEAATQTRIKSCSEWINLNLPGKDLVVVGFWTDWGYLNDVLTNAFTIESANSVTVIDLSPESELQNKAPTLWAKLHSLSNEFNHIQASSDEALDQLRTEFSKTWIRRFYSLGEELIRGAGGSVSDAANPEGLTAEDLYNLRLDGEGVPYTRAALRKRPDASAAQASLARIMLLNAGATKEGPWLKHNGRSVRVVNGGGQGMSSVQSRYREPTSIPQSDIVVCAGAIDLHVPGRIIAPGHGASTVRPAPGGGATWLTLEQAQADLNL